MEISKHALRNLVLNNRAYDINHMKIHEIISSLYLDGKPMTAIADLIRVYLKNLVYLGMEDNGDLSKAKSLLRETVKNLLVTALDHMEGDQLDIPISEIPYIQVHVTRAKISSDNYYLATLSIPHFPNYATEMLSPVDIAEDVLRMMGF